MKIKKMDIIFIAAFAAILALSFYTGFMRYKSLRNLEWQKKALSKELANGKEVVLNLSRIKQEIEGIERRHREFENQLPNRKNVEDFIVQINDIANKSGLIISAIKPQGIIQKDIYSEVPITISASATFPEVYKFLILLKKIPRINKVESVNIKNTGMKTNQCDVSMLLKIFINGKGE